MKSPGRFSFSNWEEPGATRQGREPSKSPWFFARPCRGLQDRGTQIEKLNRPDEIPASPIDGSMELFRPEIPLHLIGESEELFGFGLLDTGADSVVIGREIAATLGVSINEETRWTLRGFNGQSHDALLGHFDIEIMDAWESAIWRMPVAVVGFEDPQQEDIVLRGQTGFLQFFDVRFLGSEHEVELVPNAEFPARGRIA